MIPYERSLVARLRNKPFALLGVNCDRRRDLADRFMAENAMSWPSWWNGGGAITRSYQADVLPAVFVLDAQGVIRYKDLVEEQRLDEAVERLLHELESKKPS